MGLLDFLKRFFKGPPSGPRPAPPPVPQSRAPAPQTSWPPAIPPGGTAPRDVIPIPAPAATGPSRPARGAPERRETKLSLDADQFKPLPVDQLRATALSTQFTNWFEFGRRDRIPSAADPRTKLIDLGMVGHGLVTPEELSRIHDIGQQMDELRPELAGAHLSAQKAVEVDRAERQRIKAEKKAAAEQRKREHAARVAANKLNDIVHLGRGVSAGLADRRSNIEQLQQRSLPILSTPADVANALGVKIPKLRWLAYHAEASTVSHYVQFLVPKKSGGERTLCAPQKQLATAQRWIFEQILTKLPAHDAAHGFVKGRSIVTNATPHVGAAVVVNADLENFFPSITVHRVIGMFRQIGYSPAVATILALLCTECPRRKVLFNGKPWHVATGSRGLPQGACTSPAISNLIARRVDSRLTGIARKLGWTYSRYADDLTFSSRGPSDRIGYLLARLRHIADDEGFVVNEKKTRVLKQAARQAVTGVVVNKELSTSRRRRRQLRAIIHNVKKTGLHAQNRERVPHFAAWLRGTVEFISMVNKRQGMNLRERLNSLSK